jgi:FkbM family methyltransferase
MSAAAKLSRFVRTARALGPTPAAQARILWALSKNLRVAALGAKHDPARIYALATRLGDVHLRDNFGDVTNLPGLLVENTYRVTKLDRPGEILDVGANIGLFAKWIHAHNPERRLHCFEPLPSNANMVRLNCPRALVNQVGVGSRRGKVQVGVDEHAVMASSVAQRWALKPIEFEVLPLDEYAAEQGIHEVAFFKLDTEGMELDVMEGAQQLLARTHVVAMETHGEERHRASIERLRAAGFAIDAEERMGAVGMVWASRK